VAFASRTMDEPKIEMLDFLLVRISWGIHGLPQARMAQGIQGGRRLREVAHPASGPPLKWP
jgi:hypothetical protein